jgi:hypothetical protein
MSSYCEDFPCCGHTDGLGCDWVSPNEIQPCQICIDARASYPYHEGWAGSCPTIKKRQVEEAMRNIPEGFECDECGDSTSKHPDFDTLCGNCGYEAEQDHHEMMLHQGGYEWDH